MQLTDRVIAKLKKHVRFEREEDLAEFVSDALNTYVALGSRVSAGDNLVLLGADGKHRRVVLPCSLSKANDPR